MVQGGGVIQGGWRWHTRMEMKRRMEADEDDGGVMRRAGEEDGGTRRLARRMEV